MLNPKLKGTLDIYMMSSKMLISVMDIAVNADSNLTFEDRVYLIEVQTLARSLVRRMEGGV